MLEFVAQISCRSRGAAKIRPAEVSWRPTYSWSIALTSPVIVSGVLNCTINERRQLLHIHSVSPPTLLPFPIAEAAIIGKLRSIEGWTTPALNAFCCMMLNAFCCMILNVAGSDLLTAPASSWGTRTLKNSSIPLCGSSCRSAFFPFLEYCLRMCPTSCP